MTDEPDLSMLLPTTATYLRRRAEGFALARLRSDPGMRYFAGVSIDVLIPLSRDAERHGPQGMQEMDTAHLLMVTLNRFAREAVGR